MKIDTKQLDHLVYCVHDLEEGVAQMESLLGVTATKGGQHKTKGTHNALISLGEKCYLEILAIDYGNMLIGPRWMGIDHLHSSKITRWAIQSDSIIDDAKLLKAYNPQLAQIDQGQRFTTEGNMLKWQMTLPLSKPEIELLPFLIDWSKSEMHPTDKLSSQCSLLDLKLEGPKNNSLSKIIGQLINVDDFRIDLAEHSSIKATISTPKGIVVL